MWKNTNRGVWNHRRPAIFLSLCARVCAGWLSVCVRGASYSTVSQVELTMTEPEALAATLDELVTCSTTLKHRLSALSGAGEAHAAACSGDSQEFSYGTGIAPPPVHVETPVHYELLYTSIHVDLVYTEDPLWRPEFSSKQ